MADAPAGNPLCPMVVKAGEVTELSKIAALQRVQ